jgi:hypothetical protein
VIRPVVGGGAPELPMSQQLIEVEYTHAHLFGGVGGGVGGGAMGFNRATARLGSLRRLCAPSGSGVALAGNERRQEPGSTEVGVSAAWISLLIPTALCHIP